MTLPAIILAAGASRRLGQPKQLLKYRGETLLERALRAAREAGASPVLAMLGAHFAPICAMIPFEDAIPVLNDHWEQGISSSIHAGLSELEVRAPDASGALVMSCDQPRLTAKHLRALLKAFCRAGNALDRCIGVFRRAGRARRLSPLRLFRVASLFAATRARVRCWLSRRAR